MDKFDIMLWIMGGGFGLMFGLMLVMWHSLNQRMDKLDLKIDKTENGLNHRLDKLDEKITDIDLRLCRLEGAFASKGCCMIKDDRSMKKAE